MAIQAMQTQVRVGIHPEVLKRFPETKVAVALIEVIVRNSKNFEKAEGNYLSDFKQRVVKHLIDLGVTPDNYKDTAVCRSWKDVYATFKVTDKNSTIESLLKRATQEESKILEKKKADLGKISNFVDMYNCVSIQEMTPMGALDASKVKGDIQLRMGKEGETFLGLGRTALHEKVTADHVVYADDEKVLTWLWNYRDAAAACVPDQSEGGKPTQILLFADQAHQGKGSTSIKDRPGDAEAAIALAMSEVTRIGGKVLSMEVMSGVKPQVTFNIKN